MTATSYWIASSPGEGLDAGGDFASCVELTPQRRAIVVGDVAGRSAGASEAAIALHAHVRRLVARHTSPSDALLAAHDYFIRTFLSDEIPFASLFLCVADVGERQIRYASAGHPSGLLFNRDATAHAHLAPTGPLLGPTPAPVFEQHALPLFRDSFLVVVTDGITDARPSVGDDLVFFGTTGVARAVHAAVMEGSDPARETYRAAVRHAGHALGDDASVVVTPLIFPKRVRPRPVAIDALR
jgi:serine phosphatase RsbU (regulator of sigma subunit)